MSNKERIIQLINEVPDNKLISIEPDEWDKKMIAQSEKYNDGETTTLEELCEEMDITL